MMLTVSLREKIADSNQATQAIQGESLQSHMTMITHNQSKKQRPKETKISTLINLLMVPRKMSCLTREQATRIEETLRI